MVADVETFPDISWRVCQGSEVLHVCHAVAWALSSFDDWLSGSCVRADKDPS